MSRALSGPALIWWVALAIFAGGLLVVGLRQLWFWWLRRTPSPRPSADAKPGHYVVRWEHIDFCSRTVYDGSDLKRARHLFYYAEGIIKGSTVEFWDGPHCRGRRIA